MVRFFKVKSIGLELWETEQKTNRKSGRKKNAFEDMEYEIILYCATLSCCSSVMTWWCSYGNYILTDVIS